MNFADLLTEHRIPFDASGRNTRHGWLNLTCPYCGKNPYMGYNLAYSYVSCWNCGRHPLWETIHLLTGLPARKCIELVGELPRTAASKTLNLVGKLKLPDGIGPLTDLHKEYLVQRGFDPTRIASQYEVQGIGQEGGMLRWRLFIPIRFRDEIVSWTTRAIGNKEPRYWSAKDDESRLPIPRLLYGFDSVRNALVLCEGPLDAWAIGPGAVACCGLLSTPARLELLSRVPVRYICFDREPAAQRRARKLANDLSVFSGVTKNIILETGKDPAAADKSEIEAIRECLK